MGSNESEEQLHIVFFPFMAQGHLIPAIDMAKLFASRGHRSTIITTSYFAAFLSKTVLSAEIDVVTIKVPASEAGLSEDVDSVHKCTTPDMQQQFYAACGLLGPQTAEILRRCRPDCLVADMFFPWVVDVADELGVPTLAFHGTSCFSQCVSLSIYLNKPHDKVSSDSEVFLVPDLPDEPEFIKEDDGSVLANLFKEMKKIEPRYYGVLVNSFRELEPGYPECFRDGFGRKAWHIGPLFLYEKGKEGKAERGMDASVDGNECLKWLDSKEPNSVIYVNFGSVANFNDEQLMEIAAGLEASGQQFVWAVKREKREGVKEEWLPDGFEGRVEGKGLIVRGWAPQVLILEHKAVGGFVTHCGWNSTLESVCAGVPMVTWPVSAEQFYNEKLVAKVLRIGTEVGARKWKRLVGDFVRREAIDKAVRRVMEGEEAEEMRSRVRKLAQMAKSAIAEGGSSVSDLNELFEDLRLKRIARNSS